MGLDTSHGCFHGPYSKFNRLRQYVAKACGGSFPPHDPDFTDEGVPPLPGSWYYETTIVPAQLIPGMTLFLGHSDCSGELNPEDAKAVAQFLRWVVTRVPEQSGMDLVQGMVETFAAGCEEAASRNETVYFE